MGGGIGFDGEGGFSKKIVGWGGGVPPLWETLPVEQMNIATGFVTLVHSYIQVTARLIDYILFVRALGQGMWKQLVKVPQLKYPTISYTNKRFEGN